MSERLLLRGGGDLPALIDEDCGVISYAALESRVAEASGALRGAGLLLIIGRNDVETLVHYLAALECGVVPLLLGSGIHVDHAQHLIDTYAPRLVLAARDGVRPPERYCRVAERGRYMLYRAKRGDEPVLHQRLALLLPTSGSTGSPKLVRLSLRNLVSNAESIAQYLGIGPAERAITTLPYNYSYGLSVINSHLHAGGTIVLSNRSLLERDFWQTLRAARATSLAGVPYTYEMLLRLGLQRLDMPSIRTMTQAGGKLAESKLREVANACRARGIRFFTMYGQTEATARIAYLDPQHLDAKAGSIGKPIPGGALHLRNDCGEPITRAQEVGELVYRGDNVSLGYAEHSEDLARGDDNQGTLRTGDLARVDEDGFYFLAGRLSRFVKVYGVRISTDDVEKLFAGFGFPAAATGNDDLLKVGVVCPAAEDLPALRGRVAEIIGINPAGIRLQRLDAIPRLVSGKVDYRWIDQTL